MLWRISRWITTQTPDCTVHSSGIFWNVVVTRFKKIWPWLLFSLQYCKIAMTPLQSKSKKPPKNAIANGFAIASSPTQIPNSLLPQEGEYRMRWLKRWKMYIIMKAMVAPVRQFIMCSNILEVFKMHSRNSQFFQTDQNCATGVMNYLTEHNVNNIFVMIVERQP